MSRDIELYRLCPELGMTAEEAGDFAVASAAGAYPAFNHEDPVEVADHEFDEGRSRMMFLEAY